jgi:hypothetical protein
VPDIDFVQGDATGITIPAHRQAFADAGPEFLTQAFRTFGSLGAENAVSRIVESAPCSDGNSGDKLFLTVAYERADAALDTELFVKFSRDFADAFRDRRRYELEAEVRLAALSRHPAFPVAVAKPYFADFNHETGTGILITRRIRFGEDGIEPLREKCMDHELANPLEHYRATVTALAKLAAAQQSGRLSPEVDELFPRDAQGAMADLPIPWDEAGLRDAVARIRNFVSGSPQLFPLAVAAPAFLDRLEADAVLLLQHEADIRRFLYADPRFVALAHWNTNIDNAWFWRDAEGVLQAGLLDWGMVRRMNVGLSIWGGLSAAGVDMLEGSLDKLLALYAEVLGANGGAVIDPGQLGLHFDLSLVLVGFAMMMDLPTLIQTRLPEAANAVGPRDPLIRSDTVVRGFLHVATNFLNLWARRDFAASLKRVLAP